MNAGRFLLLTKMNQIRKEFTAFIEKLSKRFAKVGLDMNVFPVDHVCYRVEDLKQYKKYSEIFVQESMLYCRKIHHGREFQIFILRDPLKYNDIEIPCLEFSEPGGSDVYKRGFQHLEFLTNVSAEILVKSNSRLKAFIVESAFGDESYFRWPDKIVLKLTSKPLIVKSLLEGKPEFVYPT